MNLLHWNFNLPCRAIPNTKYGVLVVDDCPLLSAIAVHEGMFVRHLSADEKQALAMTDCLLDVAFLKDPDEEVAR